MWCCRKKLSLTKGKIPINWDDKIRYMLRAS